MDSLAKTLLLILTTSLLQFAQATEYIVYPINRTYTQQCAETTTQLQNLLISRDVARFGDENRGSTDFWLVQADAHDVATIADFRDPGDQTKLASSTFRQQSVPVQRLQRCIYHLDTNKLFVKSGREYYRKLAGRSQEWRDNDIRKPVVLESYERYRTK